MKQLYEYLVKQHVSKFPIGDFEIFELVQDHLDRSVVWFVIDDIAKLMYFIDKCKYPLSSNMYTDANKYANNIDDGDIVLGTFCGRGKNKSIFLEINTPKNFAKQRKLNKFIQIDDITVQYWKKNKWGIGS